MKTNSVRRSESWAKLFVAIAVFATTLNPPCGAEEPIATFVTTNPYRLNRWVKEELCKKAGSLCNDIDIQEFGYRLSLFPRGLRRGVDVKPYASASPASVMECPSFCSLYFLDLRPGDHFAHPTVVGLYDHESGELQTARGEWWPVLNDDHHVLDTLRMRTRSSVDEKTGRVGPSKNQRRAAPAILRPAIPSTVTAPPPGSLQMIASQPCRVLGLVANGYRDSDNTFDDDAEGMYDVLRGLGLSDDRIIYVGPYKSQERDYLTSPENLKSAIKEIRDRADGSKAKEVVFFLSTHGGTRPDPLSGDSIYFVQLKARGSGNHRLDFRELTRLLCSVDTSTLTIVVEGCQSGHIKKLIEGDGLCQEKMQDGMAIRMLLSAGETKSSSADIDGNDKNLEDVGSETIWGYIEAFGTSAADFSGEGGQPDGRISFCEAVTYAKLFDGARGSWETDKRFCSLESLGKEWKAVVDLDETDDTAAHSCLVTESAPKVEIVPTGGVQVKHRKKVDPYGVTQVVKRCTNTPVWVTIENLGPTVMPVGTIRLFGSVLGDDGSPVGSRQPYANLALVSALGPEEKRSYKIMWGVRPIFKKKQRVELWATFDSPLVPVGRIPDELEQSEDQEAEQPPASDPQTCRCEISVVKRCFPIIGCNCRKYAGPETLGGGSTN